MDVYIPSAKESCRYYDQAQFPALSLKPKIEALWSKVFMDHVQCIWLCYKRHCSLPAPVPF